MKTASQVIASSIYRTAAEANYHPIDRGVVSRFSEDLQTVSPSDFVTFSLHEYSDLYCTFLFACIPEIWRRVSSKDLDSIFESVVSLDNAKTIVQFLYKYLEVDAFPFFLRDSPIPIERKLNLFRFYRGVPELLFKDEDEFEELNEQHFGVAPEDLNYTKSRLLENRVIEEAQKEIDKVRTSMQEYISTINSLLGLVED